MGNSQGIDYGMGKTNINLKTGIRYGVIPIDAVMQAWYDSAEPFYPNVCPHCYEIIKKEEPKRCPHCHKQITDEDRETFEQEATSYFVDDGEYDADAAVDGNQDIFIFKSPYYTYAQFCSPCAPGACYLMAPLEEKVENNRAYCFGHEWFEHGVAPYPVYSVKTNKQIISDKKLPEPDLSKDCGKKIIDFYSCKCEFHKEQQRTFERLIDWIKEGDYIAVYSNHDLGSPEIGRLKFRRVKPTDDLEKIMKDRLPDTPTEVNWQYYPEEIIQKREGNYIQKIVALGYEALENNKKKA